MEIKHTEIINGQRDGDIVFVCDYRRPDKNKKPIRSLPPTEEQKEPSRAIPLIQWQSGKTSGIHHENISPLK
jgi:hypothetical protein